VCNGNCSSRGGAVRQAECRRSRGKRQRQAEAGSAKRQWQAGSRQRKRSRTQAGRQVAGSRSKGRQAVRGKQAGGRQRKNGHPSKPRGAVNQECGVRRGRCKAAGEPGGCEAVAVREGTSASAKRCYAWCRHEPRAKVAAWKKRQGGKAVRTAKAEAHTRRWKVRAGRCRCAAGGGSERYEGEIQAVLPAGRTKKRTIRRHARQRRDVNPDVER